MKEILENLPRYESIKIFAVDPPELFFVAFLYREHSVLRALDVYICMRKSCFFIFI